jgi:hypothetical protein
MIENCLREPKFSPGWPIRLKYSNQIKLLSYNLISQNLQSMIIIIIHFMLL